MDFPKSRVYCITGVIKKINFDGADVNYVICIYSLFNPIFSGCCFKCASGIERFRNFMDRFKFISHALFLYLASGILIYIPMGAILTYLPTGQIDQVEASDVDAPEMFSLEWLRSTKNIKCLMIFVYFLGALLYPAFAAVYYKV